jgi:hypothetical protein
VIYILFPDIVFHPFIYFVKSFQSMNFANENLWAYTHFIGLLSWLGSEGSVPSPHMRIHDFLQLFNLLISFLSLELGILLCY